LWIEIADWDCGLGESNPQSANPQSNPQSSILNPIRDRQFNPQSSMKSALGNRSIGSHQ
jgi:hypothetical protein